MRAPWVCLQSFQSCAAAFGVTTIQLYAMIKVTAFYPSPDKITQQADYTCTYAK